MAVEIMELSVALFFLWAFVYYFYRDYRLDMVREELFVVRAELFELAASEQLAFSDPAYTILRNFINQLIRYAHTITMSRFILVHELSTLHPNCTRNVIEEWKEAVAKIGSEEVRKRLHGFHSRIAQAIGGQLIKRSVCLFSLILFLSVLSRLLGSGHGVAENMIKKEDIERFESQVIEAEKQEPQSELVPA